MTDQIPTAHELSEPVFADPDPTVFVNRYPTRKEMLYRGGREGVKYCFVAGERIGYYTRLVDPETGQPWSLIKADRNSTNVPTITIKGPKGTDDSVVLMATGDPIIGSDDHNGIRKFYVDTVLEEKVGIPANPDSPVAKTTTNLPNPKQVQADSEDGRKRTGAALGKSKIQVIEGK